MIASSHEWRSTAFFVGKDEGTGRESQPVPLWYGPVLMGCLVLLDDRGRNTAPLVDLEALVLGPLADLVRTLAVAGVAHGLDATGTGLTGLPRALLHERLQGR